MPFDLHNDVVIITGGAGLLGKNLVQAVVENGGRVVCADCNSESGIDFVEHLSLIYGTDKAVYYDLDITSLESVHRLISFVISKWGRLNSLVNCAYPRNANYGKKFEDVTYPDFCENVASHLGGYFLTSQQAAIHFKQQKRGSIINFASIYGVSAPRFDIYADTPITMPVEYAAIKSAVIHMTKYIAAYYKGFGVRANCISPGGILNNQPESFIEKYNSHSLNKGMLSPDDIIGTVLFLLSKNAEFINGQNIIIDDGWTL